MCECNEATGTIQGSLVEEGNGAFYPIRLATVPRVGDLIALTSRIEARDGREPRRDYIVTRITHELTDAPEGGPVGQHSVSVHVRRIVS